jgi:vitamin B12 transporter
MKSTLRPVRLAAAGLFACSILPGAAVAQSALRETVVTATRSAVRADELVSDVVVLDRADIERSAGRTLPELLARSAGVQFSANGGLGKVSSIFIRGTEARHTVLLIDGVRYGSATAGTPIWDNIPLDMIERIEVLKGPGSSLYGSDAVGGVVQIFTRAGKAGFHPQANLTVGSRGFAQLGASLAAGKDAWTYSLGAQKTRETGFSATNASVPFGSFNPDNDGFNQGALNASAALQINADWKADAGLLHSDGISQFDDGPGRDSRATLRTQTLRAGVQGRVLPGWKSRLRFSQGTDTNNAIVAGTYPSSFITRQDQWTWQNDVDTPLGVALLGAEQLQQKVDATTAYTVTRRTVASAFAGLNGSAGVHSWQVNLRQDNNSQFGNAGTGFAGYGWRITPAWRAWASYGTSFVAPSFNQLYFPGFGNALLQPERGRNTDLGLSWSQNGQSVKLVRYDNRIRGFITSTTLPVNLPQARIRGVTLGYDGSVGPLGVHAAVDALDPRNDLTGKLLPRRSKSQATLAADYASGAWQFGGNLLRAGMRFDDTANLTPLGGYTTLDLFAAYKVTSDWKLQAKVNNLGNQQYQTVLGYNQPGRSVYVTLRYQPQ